MSAESTNNPLFIKAAADAQNLSVKPSNEDLLRLYALYKQSIFGDNDTSKPYMFDMKGAAKWNAWYDLKGKPKEEAQQQYITMVDALKQKK